MCVDPQGEVPGPGGVPGLGGAWSWGVPDLVGGAWSRGVPAVAVHILLECILIFGMFLPPAMKLGQGDIFSSMCQEFCPKGGVPGQVPPLGRYTPYPWAGTPPGYTPWVGTPPMVNEQVVHILLECILVFFNSVYS